MRGIQHFGAIDPSPASLSPEGKFSVLPVFVQFVWTMRSGVRRQQSGTLRCFRAFRSAFDKGLGSGLPCDGRVAHGIENNCNFNTVSVKTCSAGPNFDRWQRESKGKAY